MGVSKNRGNTPMDGENHGKPGPYEQMDDLGGFTPLFLVQHPYCDPLQLVFAGDIFTLHNTKVHHGIFCWGSPTDNPCSYSFTVALGWVVWVEPTKRMHFKKVLIKKYVYFYKKKNLHQSTNQSISTEK